MASGESVDEISDWLSNVTEFYLKLGDDQKNHVLNSLISISGPNQLVCLSEMLPSFLFRDFMAHLPSELLMAILKHLDGHDLLSCCQVSRCWKDRIESLVDLWTSKIRHLGAIIPVTGCSKENGSEYVSSINGENPSNYGLLPCGDEQEYTALTPLQMEGKRHKRLYMKAVHFNERLRSGAAVVNTSNFIHTGNRRISSLMFHDNYSKYLFLGTDNQVQVRSLTDGKVISTISTHSVSAMTIKGSTLYTASFNATLESWYLGSGRRKHTFHGHTAAVLSVDVSEDGRFVLTGAGDRTARLWDQRGEDVELMITLDNIHENWVFKVKFISCQMDVLNFITVDSSHIQVWTFDLDTHQVKSDGIRTDKDKEFISASFERNSSSKIFASAWSEVETISEILSLEIKNGISLELRDKWHVPEKIKANILSVGLRFMLVMCSISSNDFFILDRKRKCRLARISTPCCLLTRTLSSVAVCDDSWLDGFDLNRLQPNRPLFAACMDRHSIVLVSWSPQLYHLHTEEKKEEEEVHVQGVVQTF